ncbi:MAG: hypothetical protein ABSB41_10845 [Anaerolineales bacterium]
MRFQPIVLAVLLSLVLSACSLAEDITPPPGYLSPTAPLSTSLPVATAQTAIPGLSSPTSLPTALPPNSETATPAAASTGSGAPGTPSPQIGVVTGKVVASSGVGLLSGLTVSLYGLEQDPNGGTPTQVLTRSAPLAEDGAFRFEQVEMPAGRIFVSIVVYDGVPYQSTEVTAAQGQAALELPQLTIYPVTQNLELLQIKQVHILLDFSAAQSIQAVELYVIANPSQQTVLVPSDGSSVPFAKLPSGASNASIQTYTGGATFLITANGLAMPPVPADQMYGLEVAYTLPSAKKFKLTLPFVLPADSVTVFVPEGVQVSGNSLSDQGIQNIQGLLYHQYDASSLAAGAVLDMTISGSPASSGGGASSTQTGLVIAVGILGLMLIGAGVFFFLRDRNRQRFEPAPEADAKVNGNGADEIADAIVALDDQYRAGGIAKDVYEQRRSELKDQLRNRLG